MGSVRYVDPRLQAALTFWGRRYRPEIICPYHSTRLHKMISNYKWKLVTNLTLPKKQQQLLNVYEIILADEKIPALNLYLFFLPLEP